MAPSVNDELLSSALELVSNSTGISRSDISDQLGISSSSASNIARILLSKGLIIESGTIVSTGGRPATALVSASSPDIVAVAEVGTKHARLALSERAIQLTMIEEISIDLTDGPQKTFEKIYQQWQKSLKKLDNGSERISHFAVALPGPVQAHTQRLINPARIPNWQENSVQEALESLSDATVLIDNDARAAARGEAFHRRGTVQNFIYVKAGSGIGASFILNGEPYIGADGIAGDITHSSLGDKYHEPCSCGKTSCLETEASGAAIRRKLATKGNHISSMLELIEEAEISNPTVIAALRDAGKHIGHTLTPLVNFLNPKAVILGGSMSKISHFTAAVRAALYDKSMPMCSENLLIEPSFTAANAALIGLLYQVRTNNSPSINAAKKELIASSA